MRDEDDGGRELLLLCIDWLCILSVLFLILTVFFFVE